MQFVFVDYGFAHTTLFPLVRWVHLVLFTSEGIQGCHSFSYDLSLLNFGGQVAFDVMSGTRQVDAYSLRSPCIRGAWGAGAPQLESRPRGARPWILVHIYRIKRNAV